MSDEVLRHMRALMQRLESRQVSYEHVAGAVDALIVAQAITLGEAMSWLSRARRFQQKG